MEMVKSQYRRDLMAFTKKKKRQSKTDPFYYQIIAAILFGVSIVLPYVSGIYGVPSVCLESYKT